MAAQAIDRHRTSSRAYVTELSPAMQRPDRMFAGSRPRTPAPTGLRLGLYRDEACIQAASQTEARLRVNFLSSPLCGNRRSMGIRATRMFLEGRVIGSLMGTLRWAS